MSSKPMRRKLRTGPKTEVVKVTKKVAVKPMKDQTKAQVLKLMRTMINRETENKEVGWVVDSALHNSLISPADCYSVIQDIPTGTTGNTRLGDRIKPKSLSVQGVVSINSGYNPDTRAMYVRVIIATQKDVKRAGPGALNIDTDHLLRSGDAGTGPEESFNGSTRALMYPVNDNKFRVYYDKIFYLSHCSSKWIPINSFTIQVQEGT